MYFSGNNTKQHDRSVTMLKELQPVYAMEHMRIEAGNVKMVRVTGAMTLQSPADY
jgi:hypothetical protein